MPLFTTKSGRYHYFIINMNIVMIFERFPIIKERFSRLSDFEILLFCNYDKEGWFPRFWESVRPLNRLASLRGATMVIYSKTINLLFPDGLFPLISTISSGFEGRASLWRLYYSKTCKEIAQKERTHYLHARRWVT